ncbi:hypothetical protein C8R44DRAFT_878875 [Mycena epipterygia]|nr:hypothetical protein C8R44DRAFT_878875 [Mycena epipterygia]
MLVPYIPLSIAASGLLGMVDALPRPAMILAPRDSVNHLAPAIASDPVRRQLDKILGFLKGPGNDDADKPTTNTEPTGNVAIKHGASSKLGYPNSELGSTITEANAIDSEEIVKMVEEGVNQAGKAVSETLNPASLMNPTEALGTLMETGEKLGSVLEKTFAKHLASVE